jgi:hypothetical protein
LEIGKNHLSKELIICRITVEEGIFEIGLGAKLPQVDLKFG